VVGSGDENGTGGPTMNAVLGVDSSTQSCKVEVRDIDTGACWAPRGTAPARLPAPQRAAPR